MHNPGHRFFISSRLHQFLNGEDFTSGLIHLISLEATAPALAHRGTTWEALCFDAVRNSYGASMRTPGVNKL